MTLAGQERELEKGGLFAYFQIVRVLEVSFLPPPLRCSSCPGISRAAVLFCEFSLRVRRSDLEPASRLFACRRASRTRRAPACSLSSRPRSASLIGRGVLSSIQRSRSWRTKNFSPRRPRPLDRGADAIRGERSRSSTNCRRELVACRTARREAKSRDAAPNRNPTTAEVEPAGE